MKKIINSPLYKFLLFGFLLVLLVIVLIISTIYFCNYDFDKSISWEYWLKYFLLCLIIISSSGIITLIIIFLNYLYKKSINKNDKIICKEK